MSEHRGSKTRSVRRLGLYRIGLVGLPFFKCDEMRLLWVFTVQTAVILLKTIFEFMFNRARINFIQVAVAEVLGERVLIAFDVRRTLRNLWGSCGRWDTCACQA